MSLETSKILEVITGGDKIKEEDMQILSKYRLIDIYGLFKNKDDSKHTTEEERFVNIFNQYYNLV